MKIDYFSCTKMLYFAEKLVEQHFELPDLDDNFAKNFDMSASEVRQICDQFEHGKLLVSDEGYTEIEDDYGNMQSEISYDTIRVEKKKLSEFIDWLKKRYFLRQKPFLPREAVASITKEIQKVFSDDEIVRTINTFSLSTWQIREKKYTLTDLLFRHAYAFQNDKWVKSFPTLLAEFLNPIHFGTTNLIVAIGLFEYIDKIISINATPEDYNEWQQKTTKYKATLAQLSPVSNISKDFRIVKKGDDFYYKGNLCTLSKNNDWYKVFSALYELLPHGGEISYGKLGLQIQRAIKKTKNYSAKRMRKFIQTNLTDRSNGFMHYASIGQYEDNQKPLLYVKTREGVVFNNKI